MSERTSLSDPRIARTALWGGLAFSVIFTFFIWLANPLLSRFVLIPQGEPRIYDWQLLEPTTVGQITYWGLYAIHQVIWWRLIYHAQTKVKKYATGLNAVNLWAMSTNVLFIILHLIQTHRWYDGIAQDMSSFSSQGSVVLMLCAILLMENKRRGMFFGAKVPFPERVTSFARKYHGYLFSWAIVYTFWFHPMVSTPGHLVGFFYMFMLMLQGSLFLTRIHINKWWTLVQEVTVFFHGTMVAIYQGGEIWRMFAFGFAAIFVVTQMHGIGLSSLTRWLIGLGYVAAALIVYRADWSGLSEIVRIPLIEYLVTFALAGLIALGLWISDRSNRSKLQKVPVQPGTSDD